METVRIELTELFVTEIASMEQVVGGLTTGETMQLTVRVDGLRPPDVLIVIVAFADPPGVTAVGASAGAETLKSGAVTAKLITPEALTLKLLSPLYDAEILCVPALRVEIEKVAIPLAFSAELPS